MLRPMSQLHINHSFWNICFNDQALCHFSFQCSAWLLVYLFQKVGGKHCTCICLKSTCVAEPGGPGYDQWSVLAHQIRHGFTARFGGMSIFACKTWYQMVIFVPAHSWTLQCEYDYSKRYHLFQASWFLGVKSIHVWGVIADSVTIFCAK